MQKTLKAEINHINEMRRQTGQDRTAHVRWIAGNILDRMTSCKVLHQPTMRGMSYHRCQLSGLHMLTPYRF